MHQVKKLIQVELGLLLAVILIVLADNSFATASNSIRTSTTVTGVWALGSTQPLSNGNTDIDWIQHAISSMTSNIQCVWQIDQAGNITYEGGNFSRGSEWLGYGLIPSNSPDSAYLCWLKFGTTTGGVYSGDTFGIWKVDGSGNVVSKGIDYALGSGWSVWNAIVNPNGTISVFWSNMSIGLKPTGLVTTVLYNQNGQILTKGPILSLGTGWVGTVLPPSLGSTSFTLIWANYVTTTAVPTASIWKIGFDGTVITKGHIYNGDLGYSLVSRPVSHYYSDGGIGLIWRKSATDGSDIVEVWRANSSGTVTAKSPPLEKGLGNTLAYAEVSPNNNTLLTWLNVAFSPNLSYTVTPWVLNNTLSLQNKGASLIGDSTYLPSVFLNAPDSTIRLPFLGTQGHGLDGFNSSASLTATGQEYALPSNTLTISNYFDPNSNYVSWFQNNGTAYFTKTNHSGARIFISPSYIKN